jgi:hypothetical protein
MQYYFACSYPLEAGSIVKLGNWGRMIKSYTPQAGNAWILIREMAYEEIRVKEFPDKPSRFDAIFLCSSLPAITDFVRSNNRQFDLVYEVELVDPEQPSHEGCLNNPIVLSEDKYASLLEKARCYWAASKVQNPEFVTLSRVRIIDEIEI